MSKKILLSITICITIFITACTPTNQQTQEAIKIGVINPMTGNVAFAGQQHKKGLDLALEEINAADGIRGRKMELIYEDGQCQPAQASKAAHKLINQDDVIAIMGSYCSSSCLSVAPITEKNQTILMPFGMSPKIKHAGDFVFRNKPTFEIEAQATAEFVYQQGFKAACILYINNDYGLGANELFRQEFEHLGGQILLSQSYEQSVTDFKDQLTKIKNSDCQALYLPAYVNDYSNIAKQFKELALKQKIFASASFEDESLKNIPELEGIIYPFLFDVNKDYQPLKAFLDKHKTKYQATPDYQAVVAYDALMILAGAIKKCDQPTNTLCIKDQLYNTQDYPGAAGPTSFNEFGDLTYREYSWKIYHQGDFEFLKEHQEK